MASNYKELPSNISAKEAKRYSIGIGLINDLADSLHQRGFLPERFTPLKQPVQPATLKSSEATAPVSVYDRVQTALGLAREQVARDVFEITGDTKAYVGPLVNGRDNEGKTVRVFEKLTDVEDIYTHEGKRIPRWRLDIKDEAKTADQLIAAVENTVANDGTKMQDSDWVKDIIRTPKFAEALKAGPKTVNLVMLEVRDLGYSRIATTEQIFNKGDELGLDKCDPRVGPYQRMADKDQKMNDVYWIAMDPIAGSDGDRSVFELVRYEYGTWLHSRWAPPDNRWNPEDRIVFSLRK